MIARLLALSVLLAFPAAALAADPTAPPVVHCEKDCIVHTKDFAYKPVTLEVPVGTAVTFVNDDDAAHTVTAVEQVSQQPIFNSGDMPKGAKWTYTFKKAGTFKYTCGYHAFMNGTIIVKGS